MSDHLSRAILICEVASATPSGMGTVTVTAHAQKSLADILLPLLRAAVAPVAPPEPSRLQRLSLDALAEGRAVRIRTVNTTYWVRKRGGGVLTVRGHHVYCPIETPCTIVSRMLAVGGHLAFTTAAHPKTIETSMIAVIEEFER